MISISKAQLIDLYLKKNLTTQQIGEIFGVDRSTISNRLRSYSIPTNPSQRQFGAAKGIPISDIQKEVLIGTLLGDSSLVMNQRRVTPYFKVGHCEKQLGYLEWKRDIFAPFINSGIRKHIDRRGNSVMHSFHTISHPGFRPYYDLFYKNGIKVIDKNIGDYLTPLGMAVWYMDDGSCGRRIASHGFSIKENGILSLAIFNKFGIRSKICFEDKGHKRYPYLFFDKWNALKLCDLVRPYIVPCMGYKI